MASGYQNPNTSNTLEQLRLSDSVVAIAADSTVNLTVNTASQAAYGIQSNLLELCPVLQIAGLTGGAFTLEARVDGKLLVSQSYTADAFIEAPLVKTEVSKEVEFRFINAGTATVTIKQHRILVKARIEQKVC